MDEYIKRRRLFNALADYWKIPLDWDGEIAQPCEDALAFIENAPEEDVAPVVHGRWLHVHVAVVDTTGDCSACNTEAVWRTRRKPYSICPNCGARMDGDGNG